jgi:hypothetical protein
MTMVIGDRCISVRKGITYGPGRRPNYFRPAIFEVSSSEAGNVAWRFVGYASQGRRLERHAERDARAQAEARRLPYIGDLCEAAARPTKNPG